jgi:hypothetical protein
MKLRILALLLFFASSAQGQSLGEGMAQDYFRQQTANIAKRTLADIKTLEDWKSKREVYRQQILEMLGLSPMPQKTELKVTLVGKSETDKFTVEKIHFQSMPGLYVSANLYLPKNLSGSAPTILYLCGHARVFKNGVAYGNKTHYQHHPAWFAEHGYVAMIIDTLDLGEIQGEHHGTHSRGMWWWPTRGYTPAGVETWNAIRALDYLATRPEVDMKRVGVTGRSGGGAYTWFLAAVDDRPSVLVPVAGITDLTNHVVDGVIEGHCDCMYQVNTYAWDFALLAALAAPRPLLFSNSDKDNIFPLDGVYRVHHQLKQIYKLYGAEEKLGLLITEGPHEDVQDLQVPSFRWMNRWLKKDVSQVEAAVKRFEPEELKVFSSLPTDQINTRIEDTFMPACVIPRPPSSAMEWQTQGALWRGQLRQKVFVNWPQPPTSLQVKAVADTTRNDVRSRIIEFSPDGAFRLPIVVLTAGSAKPRKLVVRVMDRSDLPQWAAIGRKYFPDLLPPGPSSEKVVTDPELLGQLTGGVALALIFPRGIGPTAWPDKKDVHIRRRFLLLGQSLEVMQVWDTRMALSALRTILDLKEKPIALQGAKTMSLVALLATGFEPVVEHLELERPLTSLARGPALPNALRYFDLPQLLALVLPRKILISDSTPADWDWTLKIASVAGGEIRFK